VAALGVEITPDRGVLAALDAPGAADPGDGDEPEAALAAAVGRRIEATPRIVDLDVHPAGTPLDDQPDRSALDQRRVPDGVGDQLRDDDREIAPHTVGDAGHVGHGRARGAWRRPVGLPEAAFDALCGLGGESHTGPISRLGPGQTTLRWSPSATGACIP